MKLASLNDGSRDGRLVVVSRDLQHALDAAAVAPTMQFALEHWTWVESGLNALYRALQEGTAPRAFAFDPRQAMAPLPRTHQFVDASAFPVHSQIMERAYNLSPKFSADIPILVQRQADDFRGPCDDYELRTDVDGGDFEGEFAVILDEIPMGSSPAEIEDRIRLVTILNDISMRAHVPRELSLGFSMIQSKPATVFAPVAVTLNELGEHWQDGRPQLDLHVSRNGEWFGHPNGREMAMSFARIIAHLAYNRRLRAGTIIGSGTVSNRNYQEVGSACLAERRALEAIEHGGAISPYLQYGDRLRFEVKDAHGRSIFGAIDHRIVPWREHAA